MAQHPPPYAHPYAMPPYAAPPAQSAFQEPAQLADVPLRREFGRMAQVVNQMQEMLAAHERAHARHQTHIAALDHRGREQVQQLEQMRRELALSRRVRSPRERDLGDDSSQSPGDDDDAASNSKASDVQSRRSLVQEHGVERLARLTTADILRLKSPLEPHDVLEFIDDMKQEFTYDRKVGHVAEQFVSMSAIEWETNMARHAVARQFDRDAAKEVLNCLEKSSKAVRSLRAALRREPSGETRKSVSKLFALMQQLRSATSGEEAKIQAEDFNSTRFFKVGDDAATSVLNADRLEASWLCLPDDQRSGKNALLRALLRKLPDAITKQHDDFEDELVRAETLNTSLPWTFSQLARLSAQYIMLAQCRAGPSARELSAAEVQAAEMRARDGAAQLKCPNCGLKGHAPRDCPTKCNVCSHKGCPGNDKIKVRACVCNDKDKPPKAPIKNAAGKDMQPPSSSSSWRGITRAASTSSTKSRRRPQRRRTRRSRPRAAWARLLAEQLL